MKKMKISIFGTKMPYLGISELEYSKTIFIFEISTIKFVFMQNFVKKWKYLNLGPKMHYLGIFGLEFSNNYCHTWNQHPRICVNAKFREKIKIYLNLGPKMPYLVIFGLEFSETIVIFEITILKFVKHESLTPYNEFWYRVRIF